MEKMGRELWMAQAGAQVLLLVVLGMIICCKRLRPKAAYSSVYDEAAWET